MAEEERHARRYRTDAPWQASPETLLRADVAVVGAGAAGLFAALVAAASRAPAWRS